MTTHLVSEIAVTDVHKRFGETVALNGCSFRAQRGEVHAIVGENGSGKSTLAKILSGVITADSGTISVFGSTPTSPIEARQLGVATIFQEILVADDASVVDNLFVGTDGLWRKRFSRRGAYDVARDTMARFTGTEIDPDQMVGNLPISVKQWIVIGRALLTQPKALILDESSAALDLDATARLHEEIRALRDRGSIVIIVTHRIAELVRVTDRATVLRDGQVVGELSETDITEQNILALMTPKKDVLKVPRARREPSKCKSAKPIVVARGIKIQAGAPSFDFTLSRGEIVGVTGLEGHGQNRFIRALAGVAPAEDGLPAVVQDDGEEIGIRGLQVADSYRVAYVSGDRKREGIFPNLSIFENLAIRLFRENLGFGGWIKRSRVTAAYETEVKRLSIKSSSRTNLITSLSGGNQQKVLIGRALARKPKILILNDPARGVDFGTKRELHDELRRFAIAGGAVVYLSSEIEEFLDFADRVVVFHAGSVFRILAGDAMSEDAVLAAMFGHTDAVTFDFDGRNRELAG